MRMLRRLVFPLAVVLTMILAATPVSAQQSSQSSNSDENQGGIGFGVEAGITRATIHTSGPSDFIKSRNGLMGGIWFGGNRAGRVGFMGEITYVVKGANNDEFGGSELKLHYLEIPAVFRINLGQRSRNGLCVYPMFGPVVDILLKGSLNGIDVKEQFNGFDLGVLGGVGVEYARIGIEARGNWGLKTLEKTDSGFSGDVVDSKNFTIQVVLKIRIS